MHARPAIELGARREVEIPGLASGAAYYLQLLERTGDGTWRPCSAIATAVESRPETAVAYRPRARVRVHARDALTAEPIAALDVFAKNEDGIWIPAPPSAAPATVPGRGASFEVEAGTAVELGVAADGYAWTELEPLELRAGEQRELAPIELTRARSWTVTVRSARDRSPIEGARVRVHGAATATAAGAGAGADDVETGPGELAGGRPAPGLPAHRTDPAGVARVSYGGEDPAPRLLVAHPDYAEHARTLDGEGALHVELQPLATAMVRVVDEDGLAVVGASVACAAVDVPVRTRTRAQSRRTETTGMGGWALFEALGAGERTFSVQRGQLMGRRMMMGGSLAQVSLQQQSEGPRVTEDLAPGGSHSLELVVAGRGTVRGRVFEAGAVLAGAGVHALEGRFGLSEVMAYTDLSVPDVRTDTAGEFVLEDIERGEVTIVVTHPGRALPFASRLELTEHRSEHDVHLPGAVLRGVVLGADGNPLRGARINVVVASSNGNVPSRPRLMTVDAAGVFSMDDGLPAGIEAQVDGRGRFTLRGLPHGEVLRVETHAPFGRTDLRTLTLAQDEARELELRLEPAGALVVEAVGADGVIARNGIVRMHWRGTGEEAMLERYTGRGEAVTFGGLRPGPWDVEAAPLVGSGEAASSKRVDVAAGRSATLRVDAGP